MENLAGLIDSYLSPIREALIWIKRDNGFQNRRERFQKELKHHFSSEDAEALNHVFRIIAFKQIAAATLAECLDSTEAGLIEAINSKEKELRELKARLGAEIQHEEQQLRAFKRNPDDTESA